MTQEKFEQKFDAIYNNALKKLANTDVLKEKLKEYTDENGKISTESSTVFAFLESINFNREVLKSVLEEILEFDQ